LFLRRATNTYIQFGPLVDLSTGMTPATGEGTQLQTDLKIRKGGAAGAFAARNQSTLPTHSGSGMYLTYLDTVDTGTVGDLWIRCKSYSGHRPHEQRYIVLSEEIYDALVLDQTPPNPTGVASTLLGRLNQLWWRHFRKTTLNYAGTSPYYLKTYQSNDTSVATTQTVSDTGSLQTVDQAT
jgi:hypothetical protein